MKKALKITLIAAPLVIIAAAALYAVPRMGLGLTSSNLPKFVTHDYVDLSKIYAISKFRSGEGHDFSSSGETCRSMKHYFTPQQTEADMRYTSEHNGIPKPPDGSANDIAIYAPANGIIARIVEERTPIGKQIFFYPDAAPLTVRLFHVYPKAGLKAGQRVKSGEQIGVAAQTTDISVSIGQLPMSPDKFVSYFDVMPDSLFAAYQARGVTSRDQLIISKADRDAKPLQCGTGDQRERFVQPAEYDASQDDVFLSGYVKPVQPTQGMQNNSGMQNGQGQR